MYNITLVYTIVRVHANEDTWTHTQTTHTSTQAQMFTCAYNCMQTHEKEYQYVPYTHTDIHPGTHVKTSTPTPLHDLTFDSNNNNYVVC